MPKAARLHDPIAHSYAREGHAAGAAAAVGIEFGAAVAIGAVVGTIACPGLGTAAGIAIGLGVAVASFVVAHAFSLVGDFVQSFGEAFGRSFTSDCGTLTATGSTTVFINGKPAIRTGLDVAMCDKHSMPTSLVIFGSENVFIDSYRAAREGDCVDCEAKISKGSEDVFIGGESVPIANFREREVPDSDREFASKARFWAGILGGAAGALKAGVKCFGMAVLTGVVGAKVMGEILPSFDGGHSAATGAGDSAGTAVGSFLQGKPVHVVTGAKVLLGDDDTDFSLPGALPIVWRRTYASCDARTGALGTGWSMPFSVELVFEGGKAHFIDESGRDIPFDDLPPGGQMFSVPEGVQLSRGEGGAYFIGMPALGWIYCFGQRTGSSDGERLGMQQWADFNGNTIDFHRDADGVVRHVTDSAGHRLALRYAQAGGLRLVRVDLTAGGPAGTLVEYRYDAHGRSPRSSTAWGAACGASPGRAPPSSHRPSQAGWWPATDGTGRLRKAAWCSTGWRMRPRACPPPPGRSSTTCPANGPAIGARASRTTSDGCSSSTTTRTRTSRASRIRWGRCSAWSGTACGNCWPGRVRTAAGSPLPTTAWAT